VRRTDRLGSSFETPEESPGFLLWQASMLWERRLRAALEPLGLTHMQFVLLAASAWLGREEDAVTQVRIAGQAKVDVVMTSQVLRTLEAKGLLSRAPHPTDTRAKCVVVTAAGKKLVRSAIAIVEREDRAFFARTAAFQKPLLGALQLLATEDERA
jgi:DNA-binding MarR family transcriptional regulator